MKTYSRRSAIRIMIACVGVLPVLASTNALAKIDSAERAAFKYRDHPNGVKRCAGCANFVSGRGASVGSCRYMPDDTEISVDGYCQLWEPRRNA